MWNKIDECIKCGRKSVIVTAKYYLCNDCNRERLHGKTKFELTKEFIEKKKERMLKTSAEMLRVSIIKGTDNPNSDKICSNDRCINAAYTKKNGRLICRKCLWESIKEQRKLKRKRTSQNKRESNIKNQLSEIKKASKLKSYDSGNVCEGCRKSFSSILDYSHILSVRQRKDLELDENNKNMLCRSCHEKWESNDPQKMLSLACFYNNMEYIYKTDSSKFYSIYFKFNDAMMFEECKKLEEIENDNKK